MVYVRCRTRPDPSVARDRLNRPVVRAADRRRGPAQLSLRPPVTSSEILAVIAGVSGLIAGGTAFRKITVESHDSSVLGLSKLTAELRVELDRETAKRRELEVQISQVRVDCDKQIREQDETHRRQLEDMHQTILQQAQQIARLERLRDSKTRSRSTDAG